VAGAGVAVGAGVAAGARVASWLGAGGIAVASAVCAETPVAMVGLEPQPLTASSTGATAAASNEIVQRFTPSPSTTGSFRHPSWRRLSHAGSAP
jgi:hypothetical protein